MPREPLLVALPLLLVFTAVASARDSSPRKHAGWYFSAMEHDHDMRSHAGHSGRSWEPEHEVDPAGIRTYQVMYEVTRYPDGDPTPEQRRRADDLVRRCREAAKRHGWYDFSRAAGDGFRRMYGDELHYVNEAYVSDNRVLDPDRPEFLLYYETKSGRRLAAFMFLTRTPDERGPQVGGPLTVWHYHLWAKKRCLAHRLFVVGDPDGDGRCRAGELAQRSPEMMHVWLVDHPRGPFATDMSLTDELRRGLEQAPPS